MFFSEFFSSYAANEYSTTVPFSHLSSRAHATGQFVNVILREFLSSHPQEKPTSMEKNPPQTADNYSICYKITEFKELLNSPPLLPPEPNESSSHPHT
jgi:hypothetical protein